LTTGHGCAAISALKRVKDFASHVHHAPASDDKLDKAQQRINPAIREISVTADKTPRWWSTYLMLEYLIIHKDVVQDMFKQNFRKRRDNSKPIPLKQCELSDEDFLLFIDIKAMLEPFKVAQKSLGGEKYVKICLLPMFAEEVRSKIKQQFDSMQNKKGNEAVCELLVGMMDVFDFQCASALRYFCQTEQISINWQIGRPTISLWAVMLDPHTKQMVRRFLNVEDCEQL
jgi:hypothetical protein